MSRLLPSPSTTGRSRPCSSSSSCRRCAEPVAVGGDDDAVPLGEQLGEPLRQPGRRRRRPAPSRTPRRPGCRATPASSRSSRTSRSTSSSASGDACRRGNALSGSRAHVEASALARSSSSASRSVARSRIRRGSTSTTLACSGSTSVSSRSSSTSHGSHDLHPVEVRRPRRAAPTARGPTARSATSCVGAAADVVGRRQLAGREDHHLVEVDRRALVVDAERVSRSTSSPHRSMRIGASAVDG